MRFLDIPCLVTFPSSNQISVQRPTEHFRRNLFAGPEAAYKGLVHPVLEYGSSVWDPDTKFLQEELEKVQNRVSRFVTRNF